MFRIFLDDSSTLMFHLDCSSPQMSTPILNILNIPWPGLALAQPSLPCSSFLRLPRSILLGSWKVLPGTKAPFPQISFLFDHSLVHLLVIEFQRRGSPEPPEGAALWTAQHETHTCNAFTKESKRKNTLAQAQRGRDGKERGSGLHVWIITLEKETRRKLSYCAIKPGWRQWVYQGQGRSEAFGELSGSAVTSGQGINFLGPLLANSK